MSGWAQRMAEVAEEERVYFNEQLAQIPALQKRIAELEKQRADMYESGYADAKHNTAQPLQREIGKLNKRIADLEALILPFEVIATNMDLRACRVEAERIRAREVKDVREV